MKQVINKKKTNKLSKSFLDKDVVVSDPEVIAKKFNDFFSNIGTTLANKTPSSKNPATHYMKIKIDETFYIYRPRNFNLIFV